MVEVPVVAVDVVVLAFAARTAWATMASEMTPPTTMTRPGARRRSSVAIELGSVPVGGTISTGLPVLAAPALAARASTMFASVPLVR